MAFSFVLAAWKGAADCQRRHCIEQRRRFAAEKWAMRDDGPIKRRAFRKSGRVSVLA